MIFHGNVSLPEGTNFDGCCFVLVAYFAISLPQSYQAARLIQGILLLLAVMGYRSAGAYVARGIEMPMYRAKMPGPGKRSIIGK